jgi:hypothetical protein
LAIIGGDPERFAPFAGLYRESLMRFNQPQLSIGIHSPGHISDSDEQAAKEMWPQYNASFGRIGQERGWGPMTYDHALKSTGANRFDLKYSTGAMPQSQMLKSIKLYATEVIPMVKQAMGTEITLTY